MRLARVAVAIAVLLGACSTSSEPVVPPGLTARLVGVDTVVGIAVGQRLLNVVEIRDSAGAIVLDAASRVQITYRSSNPDVASIDDTGLVVGVRPGLTTVSASIGETHYTASLRVYPRLEYDRPRSIASWPVLATPANTVQVFFPTVGSVVTAGPDALSPATTRIMYFRSDGSLGWSRPVPGGTVATVNSGAHIWISGPATDRAIRALSISTGDDVWSLDYASFPGVGTSTCALAPTIPAGSDQVIAACGLALFRVAANGSVLWRTTMPSSVQKLTLTPSLIVGQGQNGVMAFDYERGGVVWTFPVGADAITYDSSNVYIATVRQELMKMTVELDDRWAVPLPTRSPLLSIGLDGSIYAASSSGVTGYDNAGRRLWSASIGPALSLFTTTDRRVLVGTDTDVWSLNPSTGAVLSRTGEYSRSANGISGAALSDQRLYFLRNDGSILVSAVGFGPYR